MTGIVLVRIADGVYTARTSPLDVNASLVVGETSALVIDTLSTAAQASELLEAVRTRTDVPVAVLNTHAHFDHCFGNAVFAPDGPIWAHERAIAELREHGLRMQRAAVDEYGDAAPGFGASIIDTPVTVPGHAVHPPQYLDLGGRSVTLAHFGRGHTDGDVVAIVPDVDVVIAGDLIESGAPPSFGSDCYPLAWPEAVAAMLREACAASVFVPGHGEPMSPEQVATQHADLARFAWVIREVHGDGGDVETAAAQAPWPSESVRTGVTRGFATLDDPVD